MEKETIQHFLNKLVVLYIKSNEFNTEKYYLRIMECSNTDVLTLDAKGRMQSFEYPIIQGCSEMTANQKEKFAYIRRN